METNFGSVIDQVQPPTLRHVLATTLPEDVLACYGSIAGKKDQGHITMCTGVALTPRWLMGIDVEFSPGTYGRKSFVKHVAVPHVAIRSWSASLEGETEDMRAPLPVYLINLRINLDRNLGDQGAELTLPRDMRDYGGDKGTLIEVVTSFAKALDGLELRLS
jgi:hypothetical protein